MSDQLGKGGLPVGKLYPICGNTGQRLESQCMWKGCHRTAVREIGRTGLPDRRLIDTWWCACAMHFEQLLGMRYEQRARMMDSIRLRRKMSSVGFRP